MRKIVLLMLLCIIIEILGAKNVEVRYTKKRINPEEIKILEVGGINYFCLAELNKTLKANVVEDISNQKILVNCYNKQLIFFIGTSYVNVGQQNYNFFYPLLSHEGRFYLPESFLWQVMPLIFEGTLICNEEQRAITAPPAADNSLRIIVLDPGHGGKDPGAISKFGRVREKDITLQIAKKLKTLLERELDVQVILTRSKDVFVSLADRTRLANKAQADLFISIHCNASKSLQAKGAEVYFLSTAKTTDARAVEAMENQVVFDYEGGQEAVKKYDDLAFILMDMAQNEHLEESNSLAINVQSNIVDTINTADRGVKQAGFYVLKGAFMPSVLIETGFITNPQEEKMLASDSHQNKIAKAIFDGIKSFKLKYDMTQ